MPRRSPKVDDAVAAEIENPLALPVPSPSRHRDQDIDPYQSPPGAVVQTITPIDRKLTKAEKAQQAALSSDLRARGARYDTYLEEVARAPDGDRVQALAIVYNTTPEYVQARFAEMLADVRTGVGASKLAEQLERADLSQAARIKVLRRHVYSGNPAASLKALDMIDQMDDDHTERGSFEGFLQVIRARKGTKT